MKRNSSVFLYYSILTAGFSLAIVLRMSNYNYFFQNINGHTNFFDPDSYYQLRRIIYFLVNFPHTLHFDPLSDWPNGSFVDWPDAFVYLIALPLKIAGVHTFRGLEIGSCLMIIFYGLLCCFAIFKLAKRIIPDPSLSLLVFFLATMNFLLIRTSCLGQMDHDVFETLYPPVILLLSLKAFEDMSKNYAIALGFMMALAIMTTSSSIFIIGVFFACYGFILGSPKNHRLYFLTCGVTLAMLLPVAISNAKDFGRLGMMEHPSFFHFSLILVLAFMAYVVSKWKDRIIPILIAFAALLSISYALRWPAVLMDSLAGGFGYVFGRTGVLQSVSEASPIFMNFDQFQLDFVHLNFGYFAYLLPLSWFLLFFYKKFSKAERVLFLGLTMLSAPGIFQKRFSYIMIPFFLVFVGWCLHQTLRAFKRWDFRIGPLVTFALLCLAVFPTLQFGFAPSGNSRDIVDLNVSKFLLAKMKPEDLDEKLVWSRLALKTPVTEGIWANPNMGNMFNYITGYGVVTNSFYHDATFNLDFKFRQFESDDEFDQAMKENKIRYVVLADDFKFYELQYRLHHMSTDSFMQTTMVNGAMATVFQMPELQKKSWVRRVTEELEYKKYDRLFQVKFNTDHFYNFVKAYRFNGL